MTLKRMQDYSGKWAQRKLTEALADQGDQPTPSDAIGLFAVLLCLHDSVDCYAGIPLEALRIDTENKRLDMELRGGRYTPGHPDHVDQVITRFMGAVTGLNFGPNAWTLNVYKTGETVAVRSYELTNFEVIG